MASRCQCQPPCGRKVGGVHLGDDMTDRARDDCFFCGPERVAGMFGHKAEAPGVSVRHLPQGCLGRVSQVAPRAGLRNP